MNICARARLAAARRRLDRRFQQRVSGLLICAPLLSARTVSQEWCRLLNWRDRARRRFDALRRKESP